MLGLRQNCYLARKRIRRGMSQVPPIPKKLRFFLIVPVLLGFVLLAIGFELQNLKVAKIGFMFMVSFFVLPFTPLYVFLVNESDLVPLDYLISSSGIPWIFFKYDRINKIFKIKIENENELNQRLTLIATAAPLMAIIVYFLPNIVITFFPEILQSSLKLGLLFYYALLALLYVCIFINALIGRFTYPPKRREIAFKASMVLIALVTPLIVIALLIIMVWTYLLI